METNQKAGLSVYLLLDGNCQEAMQFYKSCLGGDLTTLSVGKSPMKTAFPESMHNRIINARLKSAYVDISASDWMMPNENPIKGNVTCLYISGGTAVETQEIFDKLAVGAVVTDPLSVQAFGTYGALNDKFGIRWMFHAQ